MTADFYMSQNLECSSYLSAASPYNISINMDNHTMYIFKDSELYKTYPISGGKPKTPSPVGDWIIISKEKWGKGFGGAWLGLNVPWGKYGIHGTKEPWFVGKNHVSGGCIRMNNADANELYDIIPHGTKVKIIYDNQPFRILRAGDIGSDVLKVQKALKELGYFPNYCDGKFGDFTKNAIIKYQRDNKIAVTGVVNDTTYSMLINQYEEKINEDYEEDSSSVTYVSAE